jgi:hypothetical protein
MVANICKTLKTVMYIFVILAHTVHGNFVNQSSLYFYTGQCAWKASDFNMGWYGQVLEMFACPLSNFHIYSQH